MAKLKEPKLEFNLDMKSRSVLQADNLQWRWPLPTAGWNKVHTSHCRSLAVDLSINPNTVARAYAEMEIRNIVVTQQGSGTFISDKKVTLDAIERERILAQITKEYLTKASSYGFTLAEIQQAIEDLGTEVQRKEGTV